MLLFVKSRVAKDLSFKSPSTFTTSTWLSLSIIISSFGISNNTRGMDLNLRKNIVLKMKERGERRGRKCEKGRWSRPVERQTNFSHLFRRTKTVRQVAQLVIPRHDNRNHKQHVGDYSKEWGNFFLSFAYLKSKKVSMWHVERNAGMEEILLNPRCSSLSLDVNISNLWNEPQWLADFNDNKNEKTIWKSSGTKFNHQKSNDATNSVNGKK